MKYIKIERSDTAGSYIQEVKTLSDALDGELDGVEYLKSGTQIILTVVEMTEEQYESLPEFEGW